MGISVKMANSFVKSATPKRIPEAKVNFRDALRIAQIPTSKDSKLKKRHCVSIRKLLDRTTCQGVRAKMPAASSPVRSPYSVLPNLYRRKTNPTPNNVITATPVVYERPKALKKTAS